MIETKVGTTETVLVGIGLVWLNPKLPLIREHMNTTETFPAMLMLTQLEENRKNAHLFGQNERSSMQAKTALVKI